MAEDEAQYQAITTIRGNIDILLPDTMVAADMFWYPVQGHPEIVQAPDVFVVLGRPRYRRGSYRQWDEEGVAPQVVFEVWSKSNRWPEFAMKLMFYERYGVEEFYTWDPHRRDLQGFRRDPNGLSPIGEMDGWVSPLLGIRFQLEAEELAIFHPNGDRFLSFTEIAEQRRAAERVRDEALARAEQESARAEQESARADQAQARADALLARLRALGVEP